jgi:HisJ family histidinol phosphate phosphatase
MGGRAIGHCSFDEGRSVIDVHGHAKGEHVAFSQERPIPYTACTIFSWFSAGACNGRLRALVLTDHSNLATPEDPEAIATARRALSLASTGDVVGAAHTADVPAELASSVSGAVRRGLRCLIGVEADNDPRDAETAAKILAQWWPECVVRSVHFLEFEHPEGGRWLWPFDNPEFSDFYACYGTRAAWRCYIETLLGEIDGRRTDVVGHFYVPAKFGHWPPLRELEEHEDRVIDACARRSLAIEFNTRALYRGRAEERTAYLGHYRRLLRKAAHAGVAVALGSDAHSAADQTNSFDLAINVIAEVGGVELYTA